MGLNDGIVLDMDFKEGVGTVTRDKSGEGNNGTLLGPPDWVAGGGLLFDHSDNDNKVTLDSLVTVDKDSGVIVIKYKSNFDYSGAGNFGSREHLLGVEGNVFMQCLAIAGGDNGIRHGTSCETDTNSEYYSQVSHNLVNNPLTLDMEHVIIISFDSGVATTYLDGRYIEERVVTDSVSFNQLGGFDTGNDVFFDGIIYKLRLYELPLSEQEVHQLSDTWLSLTLEDGIVLDMDFKAGAGTVVYDKSGEGNNGVFGAGAAAPTWVAGGGLSFDGGDYVSLGNVLNMGTEDFTIVAKILTGAQAPSYGCIINKGAGGATGWGLSIGTGEDPYVLIMGNGGTNQAERVALRSIGDTFIVVAVFDRDDAMKSWSLGSTGPLFQYEEDSYEAGNENTLDNAYNTIIGAYKDAVQWFLIGTLYNLRVYNRTLSEHEARRIIEEWS